jgi:tetratricopeptide (TPR) repeat protein
MTRRASQWPVLVAGALLAAASLAPGAEKKKEATIKDLEGRQVEVRQNEKVDSSNERAMESYRAFLALSSADPKLRAEAMRRLGDLNLEAGEVERAEQDVAANESLKNAEAIRLYTGLLKAYPNYPRNDVVLYQLARAYEANSQPDEALNVLDRLVGKFPTSRHFDEAEFRRGEILFSSKRYQDAEHAYATVIQYGPKSQFYQQSLYKHGWSLYKLSQNEESLKSFGRLLDMKLVNPKAPGAVVEMKSLSRPDRELVDDTFRVFSITFSNLDGAKSVDGYLAKEPPKPYSYLLYSHLGDLYIDKQRYTDAADTYRAFVAKDPNDEHAPILEMQAIDAYKRGGFASLVLDGKKEFVEHYSLGTGFWQGRDPAKYPGVVKELKTNVKDLAQYYHADAQKTKKPEAYAEAARWYRSYLSSFPNDPDAAGTNYLLADTLFESQQYRAAAQEYERTAYAYPFHSKSDEAGFAALVAYEKQEALLKGDEKAELHRENIDSELKFARTFPKHPQSDVVLTRAAQQVFDMNDLPRAVDVAHEVLDRQPPVDQQKRRTAWTIVGHSEFDLGHFDKAESAYVEVEKVLPPDDKDRQAIVERLASSIYKQGEQKSKSGDTEGAVNDFLRVGQLAPTSSIRSTADFDAATALINAKQWDRAIPVLEGFRRNFPNHKLSADVTRKLAVAYSESNHPGEAAAEFERIAQNPAEDPAVQREAVQTAADLYARTGNRPKATVMLEQLVARYPAPLDPAIEARQKLADYALKDNDRARYEKWLHEIVKADADAGKSRTDRSRLYAARATLVFAEPTKQQFVAVQLTAPLKKSLAAKNKALAAAIKAYTTAADYGVPEVTTASTFEIAELYRQLAKDLMKSDRPKSLSGEALEQYNVLLEEQSFPFEEKAIDIHRSNALRAQSGVYDEWVQKSFDALAEMSPGRYARSETVDDYVTTLP